jgi:hypothetical protein
MVEILVADKVVKSKLFLSLIIKAFFVISFRFSHPTPAAERRLIACDSAYKAHGIESPELGVICSI